MPVPARRPKSRRRCRRDSASSARDRWRCARSRAAPRAERQRARVTEVQLARRCRRRARSQTAASRPRTTSSDWRRSRSRCRRRSSRSATRASRRETSGAAARRRGRHHVDLGVALVGRDERDRLAVGREPRKRARAEADRQPDARRRRRRKRSRDRPRRRRRCGRLLSTDSDNIPDPCRRAWRPGVRLPACSLFARHRAAGRVQEAAERAHQISAAFSICVKSGTSARRVRAAARTAESGRSKQTAWPARPPGCERRARRRARWPSRTRGACNANSRRDRSSRGSGRSRRRFPPAS